MPVRRVDNLMRFLNSPQASRYSQDARGPRVTGAQYLPIPPIPGHATHAENSRLPPESRDTQGRPVYTFQSSPILHPGRLFGVQLIFSIIMARRGFQPLNIGDFFALIISFNSSTSLDFSMLTEKASLLLGMKQIILYSSVLDIF